ncbi:MAG: tetratricopeptide repeat protein, partial [Opitutales bacterium]
DGSHARAHYCFAKLLSGGERLTADGTLVKEPKNDEAEHHFRQAIKIDPEYAKAHFRLGLLVTETKCYGEAFEHYEKALKINPNYAEAHYQVAVLLMDQVASKSLSTRKTKIAPTRKVPPRKNSKPVSRKVAAKAKSRTARKRK